jgi:hypothetical protein
MAYRGQHGTNLERQTRRNTSQRVVLLYSTLSGAPRQRHGYAGRTHDTTRGEQEEDSGGYSGKRTHDMARKARGGYNDSDMETQDKARCDYSYNYNDSCWFPSGEILTPCTTRRSES